MKESAAYQASGAGQQTAETSVGTPLPGSPASSSTAANVETSRVKTKVATGLSFPRFFTEAGVDPFDEVEL